MVAYLKSLFNESNIWTSWGIIYITDSIPYVHGLYFTMSLHKARCLFITIFKFLFLTTVYIQYSSVLCQMYSVVVR